jgi:hypothetical protein
MRRKILAETLPVELISLFTLIAVPFDALSLLP